MSPDMGSQSPNPESPIKKGYLKKLFSKKKDRFFVLKDRPHARLEYFESEKKYNTKGSKPKRSINLKKAWNIDKKTCAKHKYVISIYTQNEYFAMAAENKQSQEMWVNCLQSVTAACNTNVQMYKHIWQVVLDNKEIEPSNSSNYIHLSGPHRCCLTDNALVLIKSDNNGNIPDLKKFVEIKMASIRTYGHRENRFFIEPGRSLGIGIGKLWMELDDPVIADSMHTTILEIMNLLKSDDGGMRPRSYSSGSSAGRSRFRREYNPPPSQVGMGKPTVTPAATHVCNHFNKPRTRCESFPATHIVGLADEARYRTSSEGETTMMRFQNRFRNQGSASPTSRWRPRVGSQGRRFQHCHYTPSCHGSYTSSSSLSSIDHHGSSTVSEGMSSDEYSSSPGDSHSHKFGRSVTPDSTSSMNEEMPFSHCMCHTPVPPPPSIPPQSLIGIATINHEYVNTQPIHARSHSLDDTLSCGMDSRNISQSPNANECPWQTDSEYAAITPVSISGNDSEYSSQSKHQPMDTDDYADMSFPATIHVEHRGTIDDNYTLMTPGKPTTPINVSKEDSQGYVAMRPYSIAKSLPQDIDLRNQSSLPNKYSTDSYSPKSDYSRSPDKIIKLNSSSFRRTRTPQHGFKLEAEPTKLMSVEDVQEPSIPNYCSESYAVMSPNDMSHFDENSYLEMSPMSISGASHSAKGSGGLFESVLSVAKSGAKNTLQYPHQIGNPPTENTNSLDRKRFTSRSTKRHKPSNGTKIDRRISLKIIMDSKPVDQGSSTSPGGEYVNIDYQKALQHTSSYLTTSPALIQKLKAKTHSHPQSDYAMMK